MRELIVETVDNALQRALLDVRLVGLLVEVVLDRVDDLGPQGAVLVDQRVAGRIGQPLGVPSEPDAAHEEGQPAEDGDHCLGE